ncbi:MAG: hypothetical protein AB1Z67_05845 [Candidatus Limnocylindrales bacterium]
MTRPGERRPRSTPSPPPVRRAQGPDRFRPQSRPQALAEALLVACLSALAWAFLKGVLEFPGALGVAVVGGWLIGEVLWSVRAHPALAALMAVAAWIVGLVLSWVAAMALLPESSRSFIERLQSTPFLEWLSPQFGWLEVAGLVLYVLAALYGARPRAA